jgi:hypothetical protein
MRRSHFMMASLLSIVAWIMSAQLIMSADAGHKYSGTVVSAGTGKLVVKMGTEQLMFMVNKETKISLDGAPSQLDKIQPGFQAAVMAERLGDVFVAMKIEARTAKIGQSGVAR